MVGFGGGLAGGAVVNIIIRGVDRFSNTFKKASAGMSGLKKFAGGATLALAGLTAAATATVGVIGVKSVKAFQDAERAYANVNTLLEEGQNSQELFGDAVKKLNVQMGDQGDQLDVLDGLYQTISAGITDTAEATEFMTAATKASVGGSAELSTVILAGTKAMAAFGDEAGTAEDVFDKFAATVKAGQTTMGELASAFPQVSGLAAEMGISIDETLGTFAGLTKILGDSNEVATSLRASMTALLKPSEALKETVKGLGFESATTMVRQKGLMKTLQLIKGAAVEQSSTVGTLRTRYGELNEQFSKISDEGMRNTVVMEQLGMEFEKTPEQMQKLMDSSTDTVEIMGAMFQNVRAIKAIFPALGTASEDVAESIKIVADSAGLAQKQFDDMANTTQFKVGAAMSEVKNQMIEMGEVLQTSATPLFQEMATVFQEDVFPALQFAVQAFAELLAVLGQSESFISIIKFIGQIIKGIFVFTGLLFKGIEIVVGFSDVINAWADVFKDNLAKALDSVISKLSSVWDWVKKVVAVIVDLSRKIKDAPFNIGKTVFGAVQNLLGLAEGGVVTGPTTALIGEAGPEAVIPLDKFDQGGGFGMGGGVTVNIENIFGTDPDEISSAMQLKLRSMGISI